MSSMPTPSKRKGTNITTKLNLVPQHKLILNPMRRAPSNMMTTESANHGLAAMHEIFPKVNIK